MEELTDIQKEILNGHMLGDGWLAKRPSCINAYFGITRSTKDLDFLQWSYKYFEKYVTKRNIKNSEVFNNQTNKTYYRSTFYTKCDPIFTEYYNKWYPAGKKIVPKDLILTPLMIAVWFADDGYIRNVHNNKLEIQFATNGFSIEDVCFLQQQLLILFGDKIYLHHNKNKTQCRIVISHTPTVKNIIKYFYDVFPPLNRKSDVWDNPLVDLFDNNVPIFHSYPKCIYCQSQNVQKRGFYIDANKNKHQEFSCKDCHRHYRDMKDYIKARQ